MYIVYISFIFLFGVAFGLFLNLVHINEFNSRKQYKNNNRVVNPYQNGVFYGYQPEGTLDTSNPPQGGTGVPKKKKVPRLPDEAPIPSMYDLLNKK